METEVINCDKCESKPRMERIICCCSERAMGYESKLVCPQCKSTVYKKAGS